jgi:hypothetical protein
MDYNNEEHAKIQKYQTRLAIRNVKLQSIQECLNLFHEEYKYYKNNNDKQLEIKVLIKQHTRILAGTKGSITVNKKFISKITCKNLYEIDNNLILLIIDNLHNEHFITMIQSTKHIWNLIKTEYPYIIINLCYKNHCKTYKFPTDFFIYNNLEFEQILYTPITKEGRTLLHLFVRLNQIQIMKNLYKQFNKLNINVKTTIDNWQPIHNAINFKFIDMIKLIINNGVHYNSNFKYSPTRFFENIIDFSNYAIQSQIDVSYNIHTYIIVNIDKNIDNNKTPVNVNLILQEKYIMSMLTNLYDHFTYMNNNFISENIKHRNQIIIINNIHI